MTLQPRCSALGIECSHRRLRHRLFVAELPAPPAVDTVKIDRSFVSRIGGEDNGDEMVQAIIGLAHTLGMDVVAEGVETLDSARS